MVNICEISKEIRMLYVQNTDMSRKVKVTLSINKELRDLAELFDINLSAFLELKLFEHFRELILMKKAQKPVAPAGFEPASPDPESGRIDRYPTGLYNKDLMLDLSSFW